MGLADKFLRKDTPSIITNAQGDTISSTVSNNTLNLEDLDFLLQYLRNADLKGHQVEMFYNLVIKLQNQYIEQSKK